MAPGIAVGHRHLAVVVAPVALTPVAGVVGDACMRNGCGKDICLRLQVLCHETTIAGTHTSDLLWIDERMRLTNLLRTLDDILGRTTTSGIHMTRSPLLPEACSTTGLEDVGHIAQRVPVLRCIR